MINFRSQIELALVEDGYTIVERQSDVSDPFAWSIRAQKDAYEIIVQERARALADR